MIHIAGTSEHVEFEEDPKSVLYDVHGRVNRSATLDGGAAIAHAGVVHGDRTFNISARLSPAQAATLKGIHETDTLVYLSCREGYFSGAIERLKIHGGEMTMNFLAKERLSE